MNLQADQRFAVVSSLIEGRPRCMLDVGCGPVHEQYRYRDAAERITALDWNLAVYGRAPDNVECVEGDLVHAALPHDRYDLIVAADVLEHVQLESEQAFVQRCVELLRPGGKLIVTVPHAGTYAWLDPYEIKPALGRLLWRIGLRRNVHNGSCDIRKGHKHYRLEELTGGFGPLVCEQTVRWGYLYDPLLSWAEALAGRLGGFPGRSRLRRKYSEELKREFGPRSFNLALRFAKPIRP